MSKKKIKTIVYIDGFNLFYRALKGQSGKKWLDLEALCKAALPNNCEISAIKYYTARVSGKIDPNSPKYQQAYLNALSTIKNLEIYFGSFQVSEKSSYLAQPLRFLPNPTTPQAPPPKFAYVIKTEEKGSDVNLGVHLVRDAFRNSFDQAAIITNDTDLNEPIRILTQELKRKVILLTPVNRPANTLASLATSVRHIDQHIKTSQFPTKITTADGKEVNKPTTW